MPKQPKPSKKLVRALWSENIDLKRRVRELSAQLSRCTRFIGAPVARKVRHG